MNTSDTTLDQIRQWIGRHQDEIIAELQAFVRIRSVSRADQAVPRAPYGPEMRRMLDFALMRGASYGFDTMNHEGHCGSIVTGSVNRAIGIFCHLDVVPEGDGWRWPPYEAAREGDFLIGRGVADNKGACVMGLMLMRMIRDLQIPLRHGLRLVLGCSEETGMPDMEHFAQTQVMPEVSLVPDMRFPVCHAQKGLMKARLSIPRGDGALLSFEGGEWESMVPPTAKALLGVPYGRAAAALAGEAGIAVEPAPDGCLVRATGMAAHAAEPESGLSAIHRLAAAIARAGLVSGAALTALESVANLASDCRGIQMGIGHEDAESGMTTMVCGTVRTCETKLRLSVDARLPLSADHAAIESAFRAHAGRLGFGIDFLELKPPYRMDPDGPGARAVMDAYRELTGDMSPAYTSGGDTYSRCLKDAITFGPCFPEAPPAPPGLPEGHGGVHTPDEYLHIPTYLRSIFICAAAVLELDRL